jgi:three-Cys-motif partner protein
MLSQLFGGNWTEQKLKILERYLNANTTALKNKSFDRVYIEGFAGTGYRSDPANESSGQSSLFPPERLSKRPSSFAADRRRSHWN